MDNSISFQREIDEKFSSVRFKVLFKKKLLGQISLRNLAYSSSNFDVIFNFDNPNIRDYAALNDDDILNIRTEDSLSERIRFYRKIHDYFLPFAKRSIYASEYAFKVYDQESSEKQKLNLVIDDYYLTFNMPWEGFFATLIWGIWDLLDFIPTNNIRLSKEGKGYNLHLPYNFDPQFVSRDESVDESLTDHFYGVDNRQYENGRKMKWVENE